MQVGLSLPSSNAVIRRRVFIGRRNAPDIKFTNACIHFIMNISNVKNHGHLTAVLNK